MPDNPVSVPAIPGVDVNVILKLLATFLVSQKPAIHEIVNGIVDKAIDDLIDKMAAGQ